MLSKNKYMEARRMFHSRLQYVIFIIKNIKETTFITCSVTDTLNSCWRFDSDSDEDRNDNGLLCISVPI